MESSGTWRNWKNVAFFGKKQKTEYLFYNGKQAYWPSNQVIKRSFLENTNTSSILPSGSNTTRPGRFSNPYFTHASGRSIFLLLHRESESQQLETASSRVKSGNLLLAVFLPEAFPSLFHSSCDILRTGSWVHLEDLRSGVLLKQRKGRRGLTHGAVADQLVGCQLGHLVHNDVRRPLGRAGPHICGLGSSEVSMCFRDMEFHSF